ncbi:hypothetical protein F4779DRAFT_627926 [Xylariaceae sp. FL0662B]|nr:hypothetical protein F4779DRAFT_627926 [Xylariaceae sp. FL0662B]
MDSSDDLLNGEPPTIDPYEVLGLERTATPDQIKSAYRKLALKNHPDKVPEDQKSKAHENFQSIAFAYAVLSDPARRKRYDETGSTSESIVDSDGFSWSDFYREQFRDAVSSSEIEKFAKIYKGSDEEKDDLLIAYEEHKGDMDRIYETVMLSNVLEDDERFRKIIDDAIASKDVPAFKAYTKESKKSKEARVKAARGEAAEAEEYAKELGVHDKLFGNKKKDAKGKKGSSEDDLAALIQRNQQGRSNFLDNLAAKYGANSGSKNSKKGKKRHIEEEEPSEEAFQAAAASAEPLVYYPAYCFHLSPTINKWCPLRATDIHRLESRSGSESQNVFFSLNHPVRWVRIVGVVVAIDEYHGHRYYTVDDSTGECIECSKDIPKPVDAERQDHAGGATTTDDTKGTAPEGQLDIDVGMVVEVKGGLKLFRDRKQIKIQKLQQVRSTNQEVQFWNKIRDFRTSVLGRPWVLGEKEVRRCRKQYNADVDAQEKREKKDRENGYVREKSLQHRRRDIGAKRERSTKTKDGNTDAEGRYDALGL